MNLLLNPIQHWFSTNNVFNVPSATIKDVEFYCEYIKRENRDNRVRFSTIYFQGSITFVFGGIIVLNYSNGTNVRQYYKFIFLLK